MIRDAIWFAAGFVLGTAATMIVLYEWLARELAGWTP